MRQLIIARKDLQMSPGKLAAQCCHASLAFLTDPIGMGQGVEPIEKDGEITGYRAEIMLEKATYEEWFDGSFTKTICGAKNRNQLLKAKTIAEELGLVENKDFFLIRDACHTELEPEEFDENGEGMTLTCIGFRPLPDEIAHQISHKFHLYWFFIELLYFISIFRNRCSRCRSTCCRRSHSLRGNEAHRDLPAGWGNPSRPRGQNEWACPENSCRIYRPFGFAAACLAGGSACRP